MVECVGLPACARLYEKRGRRGERWREGGREGGLRMRREEQSRVKLLSVTQLVVTDAL